MRIISLPGAMVLQVFHITGLLFHKLGQFLSVMTCILHANNKLTIVFQKGLYPSNKLLKTECFVEKSIMVIMCRSKSDQGGIHCGFGYV